MNSNSNNNTTMDPAAQVGFLRHLGNIFKQSLYTGEMNQFMEELYRLWFHDWPEAPEDVQWQKNSLHHAMLAISHECLPDLMFIEDGVTLQFMPVPDNEVSSVVTTMGTAPIAHRCLLSPNTMHDHPTHNIDQSFLFAIQDAAWDVHVDRLWFGWGATGDGDGPDYISRDWAHYIDATVAAQHKVLVDSE
ncbi:hypothetical protein EDD18DRAFT_1099082 [Armillaria luteobubalina]|uniref:Uncharacterized protein n=1 Tax=Armillaria luteobubalina TaxID=153913 RepID=A0AA39UUF9_9AGAR|nr:hypothetical protein EDD18DRAFT_1099082 [Armillaria luteobubalina]